MAKQEPPAGRALQWSDLSQGGRRIVDQNIRQVGMNLSTSVAEQTQKAKERAAAAPEGSTTQQLANRTAQAYEAVQPHIVDQPVSLQRAANVRQRTFQRAEQETPGDVPHGTGWYYEHHRELRDAGNAHGVDPDTVITASAVMSPRNHPTEEKAAVKGLMDVFSHHSVHVTPDVAEHVHRASRGKVDLRPHVGQEVRADQLPRGSVAHLAASSVRDRVQGSPGIQDALYQVSRGGIRSNVVKAEQVLMGEVHPDEAIDPHSASKVWSYAHTIRNAAPDTGAHVEHVTRTRHNAMVRAGKISPGQGALDLYGGETQGHPLLHEGSHTVEDTWMNSQTFNQPHALVGEKGRTSVHKTIGSMEKVTYAPAGFKQQYETDPETGERKKVGSAHPSGAVKDASVLHAFNNRATQKAAKQLSATGDLPVPPTAVQEVVWTHARREAGKTREGELPPSMSELHSEAQEMHRQRSGPGPGQQALVGSHVGGTGRVGGPPVHTDEPKVEDELSASQQEKELRSAQFAYQARTRKGGPAGRMARLERHAANPQPW